MPEAEVRLVSGEAVNLDIRVARAGSRALALMIDIIIQVMLFYLLLIPLGLIFFALLPIADGALLNFFYIALVVVVLVGYPAVMHAVTRGRTVGKLVLGLRVVRDDGGPITWRHSFTRALVGAALEWPGVLGGISWLISITIMSSSARAQRLADLTAGTIVIHERSPESWGWVPSTPQPLQPWAAILDLTNVDDQLALAARHFLARSRSLREPYRSRLGEALSREFLAKVTPAPPPNTPGWAYLAAVIGERHRREAARLQRSRAIQAKLWPELFPTAPAIRPVIAYVAGLPAYPGVTGSPPPGTPSGLIRPPAPR